MSLWKRTTRSQLGICPGQISTSYTSAVTLMEPWRGVRTRMPRTMGMPRRNRPGRKLFNEWLVRQWEVFVLWPVCIREDDGCEIIPGRIRIKQIEKCCDTRTDEEGDMATSRIASRCYITTVFIPICRIDSDPTITALWRKSFQFNSLQVRYRGFGSLSIHDSMNVTIADKLVTFQARLVSKYEKCL